MKPDIERAAYALTISSSGLLLFAIQPIVAKALLPHFGGSAGVWLTCMLFFQVALLAGYLYAYLITGHLNRRAQTAVHLALLALSLLELFWRPRPEWSLSTAETPVASILRFLVRTVGLPYFLLSTNGPLVQSWYAASPRARFPYRLFAWSNAASLLALLAYPVLLEPHLSVELQLRWWSRAYLLFASLAAFSAVRSMGYEPVDQSGHFREPAIRTLLWIALAACASTLWLGLANHLSQEVAPIPFLWVLALSVYLLTFILCFEHERWYRPRVFRWLLPAAWIALCYGIARPGSMGGLALELPVFLAALFVCCMFCHGELARTKPKLPQGVAYFYLAIASGGALGGVFVSLVAPHAFTTYLELPIGVTACVLLGMARLYGYPARRLLRVGLFAVLAFIFAARFQAGGGSVYRARNFYGALQVRDTGAGETAVRSLYNGRTLHGRQFMANDRARLTTTFFGPESGAGLVLKASRMSNRRVGIIGLGAGTLAAYGRPGDHFRFYEINPAVVEVAAQFFRFLADSGAQTDVVVGDGRLALEREPPGGFDIIALDAFSDDTIPVHLLTREAFELYFNRLRRGGIVLIHITNRYLELSAVVRAAAQALHKEAVIIQNAEDPPRHILPADWAVVSDDREPLQELAGFVRAGTGTRKPRLWTDDRSNIFEVLK